jgi:phosphate transport system substrate-binding protein
MACIEPISCTEDIKKFMRILVSLAMLVMLLTTCSRPEKPLDTPTAGSIKISADESLKPIVETELSTFEGIYTQAHINCIYASESDAIDLLLKDSVRLVIATRHLTVEEKKYFADIKVPVSQVDVATSGIAVIMNKNSADTTLTVDEITQILQGKISTWDQLGSKSKSGIEIVFDNPNSGMIRHLKDSVAKVDKLPGNAYAAKSQEAVVDYVSKNENALGFIGLEWISDKDDSVTNSFRDRVQVAAIAVSKDSAYYQPYQAYLALKQYPLPKKITVIIREARSGLGNGFLAFFASEPGQRIVLKSGLLPATMPIRIVQVYNEPFQIK